MNHAYLHIHVLVVILFLLLFLYKALLLFLNKHAALAKTRSYTKMLDLVFGALVLVTGFFLIGYLVFHNNGILSGWLMVKVMLVLATIPLVIMGFRKHSKVLIAISLLIFLYVYGVSETKSLKMRPDTGDGGPTDVPKQVISKEQTKVAESPIISQLEGTQKQNTQAIYHQVCAPCHGEDGQKGAGGAANLQTSALSREARQEVIANGRGLMPAYRSQLTEQEIQALAVYFKNE